METSQGRGRGSPPKSMIKSTSCSQWRRMAADIRRTTSEARTDMPSSFYRDQRSATGVPTNTGDAALTVVGRIDRSSAHPFAALAHAGGASSAVQQQSRIGRHRLDQARSAS